MFSSRIRRAGLVTSFGATVIGGAVILRDFLSGPNFHELVDLKGKVAVVTGASSGIGKEVAVDFAKRGAKVILACRDRQRCEEARETVVVESQNKYVYCRYCDLSSQDSIVRFARRINNEMPKVDILVNNAGVMACPRETTKDGIEMQLGVNHMGHFLLTNLLLDKLKAGAPSRIVNVTSVAYQRGKISTEDLNSDTSYNPDAAYNQSCLANVLFTRELAKRLQGSGVTVNAVHPGISNTNINKYSRSAYLRWVTYPFTWPFIKTAKKGAQVVLYVALSRSLSDVSGKYFGSGRTEEEFVGEANADDLALWLWLVDERWTKLDEKLALSKLPVERKPKVIPNPASGDKIELKTPVTSEEIEQKTSTVISNESTHLPSLTNPLTSIAA